jgi:hypothetical protein
MGSYFFEDGDVAGVISETTGDVLVRIQILVSGCDELNWDLLKRFLVAEDSPSFLCYATTFTVDCRYRMDEERYWEKEIPLYSRHSCTAWRNNEKWSVRRR